jgi:hypothetical protein
MKIKIIILTFAATTAFWCLAIAGFFWWLTTRPSVTTSVWMDAQKFGYYSMMQATNDQSQAVTFVVSEIRTNLPLTATSEVILLERRLPPSGELWIGMKEKNTETK